MASRGGLSPSSKHDWTLVYWNWEKGKVMASQKVSTPQGNAVNEVMQFSTGSGRSR